ncbi:MAG: HAD hydrolase family protein [Pseudomonadota bacterium]
MKRLVIDIDGTLTQGNTSDYSSVKPREDVVDALRRYHKDGFEIVLHTARNMRTYQSSVGKINAHMLPVLFDWLARHEIPYDEIWTGKPWCGTDGFYVDDKAIRPDEFVKMSYDEIQDLISPDSATTASHSFSD